MRTIFIILNANTFHFTGFLRTHIQIILDLDSQQFMWLYSLMVIKTSHWPAPEPMYSPPHPWLWLAIPSSSWPILLSTQNYTSFNPKDTDSTFFWNFGNCQSEWPGQYSVQYMIWSHMNIWHIPSGNMSPQSVLTPPPGSSLQSPPGILHMYTSPDTVPASRMFAPWCHLSHCNKY